MPNLGASWSLNGAFAYSFVTPIPNQVLGSLKLAGAVNLINAPPGVGDSSHYAKLTDEGTSGTQEKEFGVRVFGIDTVSLSQNSTGVVAFNFDQLAATPLHVFWDTDVTSDLTGPDLGILAELHALDIPETINFSSNMSTQLDYVSSGGLDEINFTADIGLKQPDESIEVTHVEGLLSGLPSEVHFALNPAPEGSASLNMSSPIDLVTVEATSDTRILEEPYKHILVEIEDIPANWTAEWGLLPNPHANLSTSSPLGPVSLIVSRDVAANTPSKFDPFTVPGGAVQYTPFLREIDRRYFRLGAGDDNVREDVFMTRLDGNVDGTGGIYGTTTMLDPDEDHFIFRENGAGDLDFLSVRGEGFQCISAQLGPGSFQCVTATVQNDEVNASLALPVPGAHPLYIAMEDTVGEFLTVQVQDVPDTASVVIGDDSARAVFSNSPGDIVVYQGSLPSAGDGSDALKIVLTNTPSELAASWDLGFPGGVHLNTNSTLDFALLSQAGNDRTVANFAVGDLDASWGVETGTTTEKCQLDPPFGTLL